MVLLASPQTRMRTCLSPCHSMQICVHHLHWCLFHCSVGVLEVVPFKCHRPPRGRDNRVVPEPSQGTQVAAPSRSNRTGHPAEISAREEAASSQSVAAASKRRPSQTTRAEREQAGGAPTRFFATPEGTKLHRTKTCPTLANSHRFVEYQVCQQCHRSVADHTQHSTG